MAAKIPDTIKEERRRKLRELRDDRFQGSNTVMAKALGRQPDYISRALRGGKTIGEAFAREVESSLGLPARWLDGEEVALLAQDRVSLDAEMLDRCMSSTDRWLLVEGGRLSSLRRAELVCTLYELFFDRPETTEDQMITFLRRQARVALKQDDD